ncbi:putative baseplate assembly protein [Archangium lansingense]|uniref:putative baseplate assembly protein n=1 Tax=Archangium lansingense TaxID=2995310 RepID=UPI003B7EF406
MTNRPYNPPGRSELKGRLGTRAEFLERMRQRLVQVSASQTAGAAQDGLALPVHGVPLTQVPGTEQENQVVPGNDFTQGLLDGWATLADILCFYQERVLNEGYLRTATEDFSVMELVATLDVQPEPPVSARTDVCFTLSTRPGAPAQLLLAPGLAMQSIPGPNEKPQVFEISAPLLARPEWNAMRLWQPRAPTSPSPLRADAHGVLLEKGTQDMRPGDLVLLRARLEDGSGWWMALKTLRRVGRSRRRGCSLLAWDEPLDASLGTKLISNVEVWSTRAPELLLGATAKPWAELPLKDKLRLGTPWGGLQRMDAPWSTWKNLQRGLPLGTVLCLGAHQGKLLASVEGQGLLRSKDAGDTWETLTLPTAHVDVLCLGRDSQGRLLAGTRRHGVIRSADGGGSWELLKGTVVVETSLVPLGRNPRRDLRLPPSPVRGVAAFVSGEGKSAASFIVAGTDEGVFCFEEATATWLPFNEGLPMGKDDSARVPVSVWSVVADATRATFVLATSHGVFFTRRLGDKWERRDPGRAGQPALAALVDEQGRLFIALEDGSLYRSVDGGQTYSKVTPGGGAAVRSLALGIAAGGAQAPVLAATSQGVFMSPDGGTTWVQPPALDPVEATAVAEIAPFQLIAATPLLGVKEQQWPHWRLEQGVLDFSRVLPRLAVGQPLVLEQAVEDRTVRRAFLAINDVSTVQVTDFELRGLISRVRVAPETMVVDFDRGQSRVHCAGIVLPRFTSQVRDNGPMQAVSLDVVLDSDEAFAALVREAQDTPPDQGDRLLVDGALPDPSGRVVLVEGRRMRVQLPVYPAGATPPMLVSEDGLARQALKSGEVLEVMARPVSSGQGAQGSSTWRLRTERGFTGTVSFASGQVQLLPSASDGESAVERRQVADIAEQTGATWLVLNEALEGLLDPDTLVVYGNVAGATNGVTVSEVLGSGDATQSFQSFRLKRSPLAWVATADGPVAQIDVWVNKRRWHRVADWSGQGPDSYVYVLRRAADGTTSVVFGDGLRGARLPTGQENITATYRVGGGPDGNVGAGRIRMLRTKPLGLDSVSNPLPAGGGTAAEPSSSLRTRAPLRVRTLDRIVSPRDFEDFVRTYPGVARVRARQVWNGREHVLFLTVATEEEASQHQLQPGSALDVALREALEQFRPSTHSVELGSYVPRYFELAMTLTVDPDFEPQPIEDSARQVLGDAYAVEQRELAQPVAASDILRRLSALNGVLNVRITTLRPFGSTDTRAAPALLQAGDIHWDEHQRRIVPAEMLLLDVATGLTLTLETGP